MCPELHTSGGIRSRILASGHLLPYSCAVPLKSFALILDFQTLKSQPVAPEVGLGVEQGVEPAADGGVTPLTLTSWRRSRHVQTPQKAALQGARAAPGGGSASLPKSPPCPRRPPLPPPGLRVPSDNTVQAPQAALHFESCSIHWVYIYSEREKLYC